MIREVFQRRRHATPARNSILCFVPSLSRARTFNMCACFLYRAVTTPTRIAPRTVAAAAAFSLRFREKKPQHVGFISLCGVYVRGVTPQKTLMPRVNELCFLFARARERVKYGH